jgi:thiazole/oxazole-forming peptide maturase SagD family component
MRPIFFECIPIKDMYSGRSLLYPVRAVFWNNFSSGEKNIAGLTTSGSAGGFTEEEATLGALYEAIERDSFFCHWLTSTKPEKIILKEGEIKEYDELKRFYGEVGFELHILKTETDLGIPSCICLLKEIQTGGISISGGAGSSYRSAIGKALNEIRSCSKIFELNSFDLPERYTPFVNSGIRRGERLSLSKNGKYFDKLSFLLKGDEVAFQSLADLTKENDPKTELDFLLGKLSEMGRGYENVYLYVSDNSNLSNLGYFVVRVIVPKLYQLYLIEDLAFTKSKRIDEFYEWKTGKKNWEINSYPHPFP